MLVWKNKVHFSASFKNLSVNNVCFISTKACTKSIQNHLKLYFFAYKSNISNDFSFRMTISKHPRMHQFEWIEFYNMFLCIRFTGYQQFLECATSHLYNRSIVILSWIGGSLFRFVTCGDGSFHAVCCWTMHRKCRRKWWFQTNW